MADDTRAGTVSASRVVSAVLLGIIIKSALDTVFPPLLAGSFTELWAKRPPHPQTWLVAAQCIVFLVLLARFYWGAFRFDQVQPRDLPLIHGWTNLFFTFLLFAMFYLVSLTLVTTDFFYIAIFVVHLVDFAWFFVTTYILLLRRDPNLAPLDYVTKIYLLWDAITFAAYLVPFLVFRISFEHWWFPWFLLATLLGISIVDWIVLRDFYFRPYLWRHKMKKKEPGDASSPGQRLV